MKAGAANKAQLLAILRSFGEVTTEHAFAAPFRRWRFDYAITGLKLAVEYHGHAGFIGGKASGHSTIKGLANDCEKMNTARMHGWTVLAFTALHFCPRKRLAHKLSTPHETIKRTIDEIARNLPQEENRRDDSAQG